MLPPAFNPRYNSMSAIYEILERDHASVRDHLAEICEVAGVSQEAEILGEDYARMRDKAFTGD
jgi:hypothetical protein